MVASPLAATVVTAILRCDFCAAKLSTLSVYILILSLSLSILSLSLSLFLFFSFFFLSLSFFFLSLSLFFHLSLSLSLCLGVSEYGFVSTCENANCFSLGTQLSRFGAFLSMIEGLV